TPFGLFHSPESAVGIEPAAPAFPQEIAIADVIAVGDAGSAGLAQYLPAGAYTLIELLGVPVGGVRTGPSIELGPPTTGVLARGAETSAAEPAPDEMAGLSDAREEIATPVAGTSGLSADTLDLLERGGALLSDLADRAANVPLWAWSLAALA